MQALTIYVIANVAFEMATVLYNSFLPDLVSEDRIGRVSGYGWGIGYIGGLVVMALALFLFVEESTRLSFLPTADAFNIRATNILVAVWILVFSIPMFLFVKETQPKTARVDIAGAFRELRQTFTEVRRYREIVKFLVARLVYNDGLVTVFVFGVLYAAGTFGFNETEVLTFGIVLNVVAGLGALGFGFVDDRLGGKNTLLITLAGLIAATALAVAAPNRDLVLGGRRPDRDLRRAQPVRQPVPDGPVRAREAQGRVLRVLRLFRQGHVVHGPDAGGSARDPVWTAGRGSQPARVLHRGRADPADGG